MKKGLHSVALQPYHPGSMARTHRRRDIPEGYDTVPNTTPEQAEMLSRLAVETFVEMANLGRTFEECLTTVFVSGMAIGFDAMRGKGKKNEQEMEIPTHAVG